MDPRQFRVLVVDGKAGHTLNAIRWLRSTEAWRAMPIMVVGGIPPPADPCLVAVPLLVRAAQIGELLERVPALESAPPPIRFDQTQASRRETFRLECNVPSFVEFNTRIANLSEGGAQIELPFPVPEGIVIHLHLSALMVELQQPVRFQVLRVRSAPQSASVYHVHGKFEGLLPEQQRILRKELMRAQVHLRSNRLIVQHP